ncbi:MAG: hypothetical protein B1H04_02610, partial [Planctomycetales bacterium 4484_123]
MAALPVAVVVLAGLSGPVGAQDVAGGDAAALAGQMLDISGVKAGLCIHLGRADGQLAAALARGGMLVHCWYADRAGVQRARALLQAAGLYGQVAVDGGQLSALPYADDLADLVVVDDLPGALRAGLSLKELLRVLRPGGVGLVGRRAGAALSEAELKRLLASAQVGEYRLVRQAGLWARIVKPRPAGMDEWTHRAYDAAGNCVSRDTALGPLVGLRWLAGPIWPMGTGYQVSNGGMVCAGGRLFAVTLNEVSNCRQLPQTRNQRWFLVARDAYNGLLLWSRRIRRGPVRDGQGLARALVAVGDEVYTALGPEVVALDAATGEVRRTYGAEPSVRLQLAVRGGTLFVAGGKAIRAFDRATGDMRWRSAAKADGFLVAEGAVLYTAGRHSQLVALDVETGRRRWSASLRDIKGGKRQLLFCAGGVVVFVWRARGAGAEGDNGIAAFAAADGRCLWKFAYKTPRAHWPNGVFYVDGLVWIRRRNGTWDGLDPQTGKPRRHLVLKGGYCGGCVRDIATVKYLVSTRPPNLLSWSDGTCYVFRAGRHPCRSGVIVANGLLYSLPHGCRCVRESLRGVAAFAPASAAKAPQMPRLELGPAAGAPLGPARSSPADWPTYRHDERRSAAAGCTVPGKLRWLWTVAVADQKLPPGRLRDDWAGNWMLGDRVTAPVVAAGSVYVALPASHRVVALNARDGKLRWSYTAGGLVDSPPTIHRGLCLFGARDGWAYCLRASDGKLRWRFRAAGPDRRIVAFGQVESVRPVIGGVLVSGGVAYVLAGRSTAADGGVTAHALDPATGKVLWSRRLPGGRSDLLVRDGPAIRIAGGASASVRFDPKTGKPQPGISQRFSWDYGGKIHGLWAGPNRAIDRTWRILSVNETASYWMRIKQCWNDCQGQLAIGSPDGKRGYVYQFKRVHWSKVR